MRSIALVASLLVWLLATPLPARGGMRDCAERGGVWFENGRCELAKDDAAARCHRQGGRWLSSSGSCETARVDPDEECRKRGGIGVHEGKCYRVRTRDDQD